MNVNEYEISYEPVRWTPGITEQGRSRLYRAIGFTRIHHLRMDNPNSFNHRRYQRIINRVFGLLLSLLVLGLVYTTDGLYGVLSVLSWAAGIWFVFAFSEDLLDWTCGY